MCVCGGGGVYVCGGVGGGGHKVDSTRREIGLGWWGAGGREREKVRDRVSEKWREREKVRDKVSEKWREREKDRVSERWRERKRQGK